MAFTETLLTSTAYGVAAAAYLFLCALLLTVFRGRLRGAMLLAATLAVALWGAAFSWDSMAQSMSPLQVFLLEMAHDAVWIVFLASLFSGAAGNRSYQLLIAIGGVGLVGIIVGYGLLLEYLANDAADGAATGRVLITGSVITSLIVLVAVEQLYRNARDGQKDGLKYLCLGVAGIFVYDLVLYSQAVFAGEIDDGLWTARGIAVAACAPLLGIAAKRSPNWSSGLFVSRHVVFYTTTVFGAGMYLTAVGILGNYLKSTGGQLGVSAQAIVVSLAILLLLTVIVSSRVQRSVRVFIAKHFFENKYDYRQEWLRLIETLTSSETAMPLKKRTVCALAQILDVNKGVLWQRDGVPDTDRFVCTAGWNCNQPVAEIDGGGIVDFLTTTGWIIDIAEFRRGLGEYPGLILEDPVLSDSDSGYVVPLFHADELQGFIVLEGRDGAAPLNFEDYDLLKTAGRQIAGYLAQERASERLSEVRQFEAFNKLTAYLMHDLKNVMAQQVLIVDNAEKHKSNPEFIDDALATIESGVDRMRGIIDHLQQRKQEQRRERVDVTKLALKAVSQCGQREPVPKAELPRKAVWVMADPDKLQMGVYHALRNAQDATSDDGTIKLSVTDSDEWCRIVIEDDGEGMEQRFVEERLFKPFDSTKGSEGMGIGAYQLRESVRELGGNVRVQSAPKVGTTLTIEIPVLSD